MPDIPSIHMPTGCTKLVYLLPDHLVSCTRWASFCLQCHDMLGVGCQQTVLHEVTPSCKARSAFEISKDDGRGFAKYLGTLKCGSIPDRPAVPQANRAVLFTMPLLQVGMLVFFLLVAVFHFMYSWWLLFLCLCTGGFPFPAIVAAIEPCYLRM